MYCVVVLCWKKFVVAAVPTATGYSLHALFLLLWADTLFNINLFRIVDNMLFPSSYLLVFFFANFVLPLILLLFGISVVLS